MNHIKIPSIVAEMSKEIFAIYPNHMEAFMIASIFPEGKIDMPTAELQQIGTENQLLNHIPIQGVLMSSSNDRHGIFGYQDIKNAIALGEANPNVIAHVAFIQSPGGSVSGLAETADAFFEATKPTYAFINELGASAAYYFAAAADKIWTTKRSSIIGNIGSKIGTIDMMGILENFGAKRIEVFGTKATHKDLGFNDAKKGDNTKIKDILIDPSNEMFIQDLKRYRPALSEDHMNGIVYFSEDALKNNLVDALGTFQELIAQIQTDLSIKQSNAMSKVVTMEVSDGAVWAVKALGGKVVESTDPLEANTAEPVIQEAAPAAETVPATVAQAIEENPLTAEVARLTAELNTATQAKVQLESSIAALAKENPAAARSVARQENPDPAPKAAVSPEEITLTTGSAFMGNVVSNREDTATTK
jgi:ClpP class serine protease